MNKVYLLLVLSIILSLSVNSQEKRYFLFEPGYSYYDNHEISLAMVYCKHSFDEVLDMPTGYRGPFWGSGIGFNNGEAQMVTKIGYSGFFFFVGGRFSIIHYTDFRKNQFSLRPELGLTLGGYMSLTYGYNFNVSNIDVFNKQNHVISLSLGISQLLIKDQK
jgi:hypothetical protein